MSANDKSTESGFVRRMIDSHSILGLSFAALIYVVSLSGAITLFAPEIGLWESPSAPTTTRAEPRAMAAAARHAQAAAQTDFDILNVIVYAPDEFQPFLTVRLNERASRKAPLESTDWIADPQTGALLDKVHTPYAELVEFLHTDLLLPRPWGRYLVGVIGVCMFTLMLSGIFAHPTIFKDAFKLRLQRNARMAWTDIHNRLSVWGLPFHLVITFTGAFLGIAGITVAALAFLAFDGDQEAAIAVIQGPQALHDAPPLSAPPPYDAMLTNSVADNRQLSLLISNNPRSSGETTSVAFYEAGILSMRTSDIYRNDGEFLTKFGGVGSAPGARAFGMVQPLHYGTFGGHTIKLIYLVLSIALTWITSTGMQIWFKRKRQRQLPKPRLERAWCGLTCGLSLGLAITALLVTLVPNAPLQAILLGVWLIGLVAFQLVRYPARLQRWLYWLLALVLGLTASIHLGKLLTGGVPIHGLVAALDVALVLMALGFAAVNYRQRRRPTPVWGELRAA